MEIIKSGLPTDPGSALQTCACCCYHDPHGDLPASADGDWVGGCGCTCGSTAIYNGKYIGLIQLP